MSKRSKPKGKRINPTYWVFCEGETEEAYIAYLRSKYRLPIEIVPKVAGSNISDKFIQKSKQGKPTHAKDKDFLMYDGDREDTLRQINGIAATKIISNPSIELWFLYHYKNQQTSITGEACIKELSRLNANIYKKGYIDDKLRKQLDKHVEQACERAKQSQEPRNPSSTMYRLIDELEHIKKA